MTMLEQTFDMYKDLKGNVSSNCLINTEDPVPITVECTVKPLTEMKSVENIVQAL
jgi:hypothetical protein